MYPSLRVRELCEINDEAKKKEFLVDFYEFMKRRGTPITRLPVMAKQKLDLYKLFTLVCQKGGVLDVIQKRLWHDVVKELKIPTTATCAAYTLRNQYIKILYPYECEKRNFSRPEELEAVMNKQIGGNMTQQSSCFDQTLTQSEFQGFEKSPLSSIFGLPLQNISSFLGVFDPQQSPLASLIAQKSMLMRKMMEEQTKEQEMEPEKTSAIDSTPKRITIKREREDDEDLIGNKKKFILTPPNSNCSEPEEVDKEEEEEAHEKPKDKTPEVSIFGGMKFDLQRDENGQLRIKLDINGVKYEGALNVVS